MSIFGKGIDALGTQDLAELLASAAVENVRLEFKREAPARDETLKKVSSLANTLGGFIVVGADAPSSDGKLQTLPGIDVQAGYKQQIVQWCYEGIWPPVEPLVSPPIPSPSDSSKVCYVIEVPASLEAPHYLNGRKGSYVRTNEFSQRFEPRLAKYEEIEHLRARREAVVQRREGLARRADERFAQYTELFHAASPASDGKPGAMVRFSVLPSFPAQAVMEGAQLFNLIQSTSVQWRQVGFPRSDRTVTQRDSVLQFNPGVFFSLLEASTYGCLFYSREIEEARETEPGQPPPHLIHLASFMGHLLVWMEHARRVIRGSPVRGPLLVRLRLSGIRGLDFIEYSQSNRPISRAVSVLDDEVLVEIQASAEELIGARDSIAKTLCSQLFFSVNWPDATYDEAGLERLLQLGYSYNYWLGQRGERLALE